MRLINMACDPNYIFSIDNHDMTIIEVDGVNSQPLTVDQIQIFAAQRYSFVVCSAVIRSPRHRALFSSSRITAQC